MLKKEQILERNQLFKLNQKRCTKCKIIKDLNSFSPQKLGYKGIKSQCKKCDREYDKNFQKQTNYRSKRDKTDKSKEYRKKYIIENKDWWRKYEREYRFERRQTDMFFRIKGNLSSRLSDLINERNFSKNTLELIGCSREKFLQHIESQFNNGMNWENYGIKGWHIDHIIPLSLYDLTNENEVKKACNYLNLQPLWWYDNLEKSNKKV